MFTLEHLGKTNANQIGEHGPETLLVTALDAAKSKATGWNNIPDATIGGSYHAVDSTGAPLFPPISMTESDLEGVRIQVDEDPTPAEAE